MPQNDTARNIIDIKHTRRTGNKAIRNLCQIPVTGETTLVFTLHSTTNLYFSQPCTTSSAHSYDRLSDNVILQTNEKGKYTACIDLLM
jgi:hypothetical protein